MPKVSLIGLVPNDLMHDAHHEIERQLDSTDGELVQLKERIFEGVDLLQPGFEVQGLLQVFAEFGCVYSAFRLAYSLSQSNQESWPVVSDELSYHYTIKAMEGRISLKYDNRMAADLIGFEFSSVTNGVKLIH